MRSGTILAAALVAAFGVGCSGGDGSDLVAFGDSGCKGESSADAVISFLYEPLDAADYAGLQCVSYGETADGTFAVDLFNFHAACGPTWEGVAEAEAHELTVGVTNPGCAIAACGWCIYDWSFEVEGVTTDADLALTLSVETCPGEEPPETETLTLAADTLAQGLRCRWAKWSALEWLGMTGALHLPCTPDASADDDGVLAECPEDLVCAAVGDEGGDVCVRPCGEVAECPLPDIMVCDDGLCVLDPAAGW